MRFNNWHLLISGLIFLSACLLACEAEKSRKWDANDPNLPSSELAAVMREMALVMEDQKQNSAFERLNAELFKEIKTATHTNPNHNNLNYHAMADGFLGVLDEYNQKPNQVAFNNVVAACITCHQQFCEGPISRIQKMKIL